jgi:hypothetical protein
MWSQLPLVVRPVRQVLGLVLGAAYGVRQVLWPVHRFCSSCCGVACG